MSRDFPAANSLTVAALLTLLTALGQISTSLYTPSMPSMAAALDTTPHMVNLTFGVFLLGFAVSQLVYGPLSDRFGRRPVLLGGGVVFLAASAACTLAPGIETLIALRFLQAVGACAGQVIARAVVRDVHGPVGAARMFAYIGAALAVSPAVMPIIGGYLQVYFGWRAVFLALTAVAAAALAGGWWLLAETNRHRDAAATRPRRQAANYGRMLRSRVYMGYTGAVTFIFAGLMCFVAVAPFVFIDLLGLSPDRYGMVNAINVLGFFTGSLASGRLSHRLGAAALVRAGTAVSILGGTLMTALALAGILNVVAIIGPMMLYTLGMGLVFANGMAGAMAPFPRIAGSASSLLGFIQMGTAAVAATVIGRLALHSQLPLAAAMLVLALLGGACALLATAGGSPPQNPEPAAS